MRHGLLLRGGLVLQRYGVRDEEDARVGLHGEQPVRHGQLRGRLLLQQRLRRELRRLLRRRRRHDERHLQERDDGRCAELRHLRVQRVERELPHHVRFSGALLEIHLTPAA